jgi:hypothetical protein
LTYVNAVFHEIVQPGRHHGRTGARSAGQRLSDATLPHPKLQAIAAENPRNLEVDALGKAGVVLDSRTHAL